MIPMVDRIATIWPEISLLVGACVCLLVGLSTSAVLRRTPVWIAAGSLFVAAWLVWTTPFCHNQTTTTQLDGGVFMATGLAPYIKLAILGVGLLLLMVCAQVPDSLRQTQQAESQARGGMTFDPGPVMRGEYFAFFLLSLAGAMLCAGANDLVWLFLALELTSLPTYVMVATSRDHISAQESAVKYFFLGAMAAAVFLYGFALIYGATGSTRYQDIHHYLHVQAAGGTGLSPLFVTGLVLSVIGVSFKIAAVPMHFYAADVYQGAAVPVTAFLAFVPKTAGFVSLVGLLGFTVHLDGSQAAPLCWLLWVIAAATMTIGNTLGLLQDNVKRVLAYSSIAHTGYMLVGLVASLDPLVNATESQAHLGNGIAALLFYLVAYGLATLGAFAALGCVTRNGDEAQTFDDIAGLGRRYPLLGAVMLISVLSLMGLPPMIGFLGKIYLFGSAVDHGYIWLVIVAVLNSAVSAVYYLRIVSACYFRSTNEQLKTLYVPARTLGGALAAVGAIVLGIAGSRLVDAARDAAVQRPALTELTPTWDANLVDPSIKW